MTEIIKAVIFGHAVADALGVPVEFTSRDSLDRDPVVSMRGFGTYNVPAGSWSDDTSMAIATLDSLGQGRIDYNDIMDNNGIMHSFGRHWDDVDTAHVIDDLKILVEKYGKKNVLAALNVLKTDNGNFRDYRLGQINEEVERYNKSLDKIFK